MGAAPSAIDGLSETAKEPSRYTGSQNVAWLLLIWGSHAAGICTTAGTARDCGLLHLCARGAGSFVRRDRSNPRTGEGALVVRGLADGAQPGASTTLGLDPGPARPVSPENGLAGILDVQRGRTYPAVG